VAIKKDDDGGGPSDAEPGTSPEPAPAADELVRLAPGPSPYAPLAAAHDARDRARAGSDDSPFLWVERIVSGYDLDGPRVRMGIGWFVLAIAAAWAGMVAVAVLFGLVAGVAALQTSAAWRRAGVRNDQLLAGIGALVVTLVAMFGIAITGLGLVVFVVAALVVAAARPGRSPAWLRATITVRSGYFVALAASSAVLIDRTDGAALITLIVLVSGYEVGDFLVGTGASNPVEGPVAGIAAVIVLTFAVSVFEFPPFEAGSAWVFGGLVAVLAPLGRFAAPILLPGPDARVPALRRLDSYLLVTPVWAWMLWSYLL
jgi:hypothetical protein